MSAESVRAVLLGESITSLQSVGYSIALVGLGLFKKYG